MQTAHLDEVRTVVREQERRPDLSAEAFSYRMRIGLLLLTLIGEGLIALMLIAAVRLPNGMLDVSPFAGAYLGGLVVGLGFFLMVIYGGLVGNNPRLDAGSRIVWFMMFVFLGPIALPSYWFTHVWPAPYVPWEEPTELDALEQQAAQAQEMPSPHPDHDDLAPTT